MSIQKWRDKAQCRGLDVNLFMPNDEGAIPRAQMLGAIAVCDICAVMDECRNYAISANITVGIYGGLSNKGRREFASGKKRPESVRKVKIKTFAEIKHGTLSSYQRHKCRCEPCAEVGRKHWRKIRELRKERKGAA